MGRPTLVAGLAGGAFCLTWGLRAMRGAGGKALSVLTLVPISFVMLSQTVILWMGGAPESAGGRVAASVVTILFVVSVGLAMRIAYAGPGGGGLPATSDQAGMQATGKPASQTRRGKHG